MDLCKCLLRGSGGQQECSMPGLQWLWVNKPPQRTPSIIPPLDHVRHTCRAGPALGALGLCILTLAWEYWVHRVWFVPRSPFPLGCLGGQFSTKTRCRGTPCSHPFLCLPPVGHFLSHTWVRASSPLPLLLPARPPSQLMRVQRGLEFHLGDYSGASGALLHLRAEPD